MIAYLRHSLTAAWRVFRFDSSALKDFDASYGGFFRSFYAMLICSPLYVLIYMAQRKLGAELEENNPDAIPSAPIPFSLPFETFLYVADWLSFPLAMIAIVRMIGAGPRYVPYIVTYNWGSAIVLGLSALPFTAYLADLLPLTATIFLYMGLSVLILTYRWRIARDALQVTPMTAAGVVILDVLIGLVVALAAGEARRMIS